MLPGRLEVAELEPDPAEAGQAAGDLRPGVDLPQVAERVAVHLLGARQVAAEPGEIGEAELGPRDAPPVVDRAHDVHRGAGQVRREPDVTAHARDGGADAERPALVPAVARGLGDRHRLLAERLGLVGPSGMHGDLAEQVEPGGGPELVARRPAQLESRPRHGFRGRRVDRQRQLGAPDQRLAHDPRLDIGRLRPGEEGVHPLTAERVLAAYQHARADRGADPQAGRHLALGEALAEHQPDVARVHVVPAEHVHPVPPWRGHERHAHREVPLGDAERVVAEPVPDRRGLARRGQLLRRVRADRVEHPEPGLAEHLGLPHHQRLVDERGHRVENLRRGHQVVGAHLLGHLERPAGEDGKPAQQHPLLLRQQVVAPVDGRAQRPLPVAPRRGLPSSAARTGHRPGSGSGPRTARAPGRRPARSPAVCRRAPGRSPRPCPRFPASA